MQMKKVWAMILFFMVLTFSKGICENRYLHKISGKYRFEIHAFNENGDEISRPKGKLTFADNTAFIEVKHKGYLPVSLKFPLKENVYDYYAEIVLRNPSIKLSLVDENLNPIECVFNEEPGEEILWDDEFGFTGYFSRTDYKKLTPQNFHLHINGKHLYNYPPKIYLCVFNDLCYFEVVVDRTRLDLVNTNHFEQIVRKKPISTKVSAAYLCNLAEDYSQNLALAATRNNKSLVRVQRRLESNANQLIEFFSCMSAEEQREVLNRLPESGDLARSLKSIAAFENAHREL